MKKLPSSDGGPREEWKQVEILKQNLLLGMRWKHLGASQWRLWTGLSDHVSSELG